MSNAFNYSAKELELFDALEMAYLADSPSTPPVLMYQALAIQAFRLGLNNSVSDSLRRCLKALESPLDTGRGTPEFDALIRL